MISKSLNQSIRNKKFTVSVDENFEDVIKQYAVLNRHEQDGTWICEEMIEAYLKLNELDFAHSVETKLDGKLAGDLYGVSLGRMFYGESMFFTERDALQVLLYHLVEKLKSWNFLAIDAQQDTAHMRSLVAETIPIEEFLELLQEVSKHQTWMGDWSMEKKSETSNLNNS